MRTATRFGILLIFITIAVYLRTVGHQFILFDDTLYITNNPAVKDGLKIGTIIWAFTTSVASNWHPVTWLSHMLDVQLFGLKPAGHHLMSVVLHAISAFLLYYTLARITRAPWQSLFVAILFALHPLHVESVVWVAERKDVLSGLFWTLTILLYARYVEKPGAGRYLATLACFAVGLMSKPMLVTLPVVLLMLDYWPLGRLNREPGGECEAPQPRLATLVTEKVPFLALSVLSSVITIYAQHHGGAMANLDKAPLGLRAANAVIAYSRYLADTFWPHDLAILYPFPREIALGQLVVAVVAIILISAGVFIVGRKDPWLRVGWLWFLVTLLPVIGLIQVGGQSHADRYTYIPLTGLFIIISWGVPRLLERWKYYREAVILLAGFAVCGMGALTWKQIGYWKDSITLFQHTLSVTSNNYLILNNYGIALDQKGDFEAALKLYQQALQVWPRSAHAHNNIGAVYARKGMYAEAIGHYQEALQIKPDYLMAKVNMGRALSGIGKNEEAVQIFEQVLQQDPSFGDAHLNLALLYLKSGARDKAMPHYQQVLKQDPRSPKAPLMMGVEMVQQDRIEDAGVFFAQAVQIAPDSLEAQFNMGVFLAKQGRTAEATEHFNQALRINPQAAAARQWLDRLANQPGAGRSHGNP